MYALRLPFKQFLPFSVHSSIKNQIGIPKRLKNDLTTLTKTPTCSFVAVSISTSYNYRCNIHDIDPKT